MMGKGGANDVRGSLANRLQALAVNGTNYSSDQEEDDAIVEFDYQEQEILQLRKILDDYSDKKSRILKEKHVLEKRIALMHVAFDQQQQDLVDAATKAISYRQDIIEENIRLTYALESAQEETSTFVSTLMPLLEEFSLHPPAVDAHYIVSNLRVLLTHLHEKLIFTEVKLRESRLQLPPSQSEMNPSSYDQSDNTNTRRKESERALPNSSQDQNASQSNLDHETHLSPPYLPSILEETSLIAEPDEESEEEEGEEEEEEVETEEEELEEEDDNKYKCLPAIKDLQILGEAFPGRELQANGYSTNGTTHCGFEWVRHMEDGSVNYIEGANQPKYIVTADDVDTYLAVEVQPMDDKQRKGDLVKCFANSNRKISCAPEMHRQIERTLKAGQASYKVHLWTGSQDTWKAATLEIKSEGYSIRNSGTNRVVVTEKFSPATAVNIQYESPVEFSIIGFGGIDRYLRTESTTRDVSCTRDTIVLTLRQFIKRAVERKKVKKKRVLFFTK